MSKATAPTLHTLEGIIAAWESKRGLIYCPGCGDERQADVHYVSGGRRWDWHLPDIDGWEVLGDRDVVIKCACRQCGFSYFGAVCPGGKDSKEPIFVFVPSRPGGVVTPHTPTSVAYYLDQA